MTTKPNDKERIARRRFTEGKRNAIKRRGLVWALTFEEYYSLIEKSCYYCNYELGDPITASGGLDRIDNSKGYITGNVVSCCWTCNTIKNDHLTMEETKAVVAAIIAFRKTKLATG
jgi:hypothetical protein